MRSFGNILLITLTLAGTCDAASRKKKPCGALYDRLSPAHQALARSSPLVEPTLPDLVHFGKPEYMGIGDYLLGRYYEEVESRYQLFEEVSYYPMAWPRESSWTVDGHKYELDFPAGVPRTSDDLYYVSQARRPGDMRWYSQILRPLETPRELRHEIEQHLRLAFQRIKGTGMVTEAEVESYIAAERRLSLHRTSLFVYRDPRTHETKDVLRLFDGSETPVAYAGPRGEIGTRAGDPRLPLERLFPKLKLPERTTGEPIYELGRLGAEIGLVDPVIPLCRTVTDHLVFKGGFIGEAKPKGTIYITAAEGMLSYYRDRYGFTVTHTPEDLGVAPGKSRIYVLKMSAADFVARFSVSPNRMPVRERN